MRKKIEELRNREEGFTLVELLAVIVILGIIVAIAIPAIGSVIDRANTGATAAEQDLVEDAARLYVTTERATLEKGITVGEGSSFGPSEWTDQQIKVDTLYEKGYLEKRAGSELDGHVLVSRSKLTDASEETSFQYTYDATNVTKATD